MLVLSLRVGESISLTTPEGVRTLITRLPRSSGSNQITLGFQAPLSIKILRTKLEEEPIRTVWGQLPLGNELPKGA